MSVVIETTVGDITVDLYVEKRPMTSKNFLKLCKIKYYNNCMFHFIQRDFIAQTGDPSGSGNGGQCVYSLVNVPDSKSKLFIEAEKKPKLKHDRLGLISMVNNGENLHGSQFFFTLCDSLDYLDNVHTVFGEIAEGIDVLLKLNDTICDDNHRPYQDIMITHTVILDDPFPEIEGLNLPSESPKINLEELINSDRIGICEEIIEEGKTVEEIEEELKDKEAKQRALVLEMIGDIPDADIKPPENVLFICKLNPVTKEEDLEIIFSRFGKILSCEIIKDQKTNESLQYGFIEFDRKEDCEKAYFKMDNVLIDDRRIHVDFSQSVAKIKWRGKGRGVTFIDAENSNNQTKSLQYIQSLTSKNDINKKHYSNSRNYSHESDKRHEKDRKSSRKHETILFELKLQLTTNFDWFAFGFSDHGSINNADLCFIWTNKHHRLHIQDAKTDNNSMLIIKNHQSYDYKLIKSKHDWKKKILYISFRRYFDTCDPNDYLIDNGTTHLVYATGHGPIFTPEGLHLFDHKHGLQRAQLLKPFLLANSIDVISEKQQSLDFLVDNVTIPDKETTYWCTLVKLPETFRQRIHIVQYEAVINEQNKEVVHHMELFHCEVDAKVELPSWNNICHDSNMPESLKKCKRVIAAWAYGAKPMIYPENVGLPVGGENYSLYVMIEVHYNNPELKSGLIDNSGIRIYYTKHLRQIESGILEVGLEYIDKNSIPPNTVMDLHGYCVSECTRIGLPPNGITIFASQLHTHLTGISTWTEHIRGGIKLSDINRDNHYSPHFQEIRKLPNGGVHVYPGDALINVCRYDTRKRKYMTLGGYGITDEMCVNYLHYYPLSNLEVCKSSIDTDYLLEYFNNMHLNENQNTSSNYTIAENFNNIHWTPYRIKRLNHLYRTSPLSVQCNQSSGQRFPGYWNGIPLTTIINNNNNNDKILKKQMINNKTKNRCRWVLKKFQYNNLYDVNIDNDDNNENDHDDNYDYDNYKLMDIDKDNEYDNYNDNDDDDDYDDVSVNYNDDDDDNLINIKKWFNQKKYKNNHSRMEWKKTKKGKKQKKKKFF